MTSEVLEKFNRDGFLVLEDFYTAEEVEEMHKAGRRLPAQAPKEDRCSFQNQQRDQYFIESGDKIRFFFEKAALGANNELLVPEEVSLNKVGHALMTDHAVFRKFTFDERVRQLCRQLGFQRPAVAQSMYMFKNPGVGGVVFSHQDASYLHTQPSSVVGFWVALEDATLDNGCLKFIPGSHKDGVHRRFVRNPDAAAADILIYDQPERDYDMTAFVAAPVARGSLVAIHGAVVHRSEANTSQKSRHAYTFHVIETKGVEYSSENWLQPSKPFPTLYED